MTNTEIPQGTRAVRFYFFTEIGAPMVTFDLMHEPIDVTYSQLEARAVSAIIKAKRYGEIIDGWEHTFID